MSLIDDAVALTKQGSDIRTTKDTPESWRPRLELDNEGGFLVSNAKPVGHLSNAIDILKEFNLEPSQWEIVNVRKSQWQRYDGEQLEACRLTLKPASASSMELQVDFEQLLKDVSKWRPSKVPKLKIGDLSNVTSIGDTQYGKDAGDGSEGTLKRVTQSIEDCKENFLWLNKKGLEFEQVILPQLGDCIEGSVSQHGKVLGRSDLTVTQQTRLGRRMLMAWIKTFAPLTQKLVIPCVPGNHDQAHRITISDEIDSWQIEVVDAVQMACSENPDLAHVEFRYPDKDHGTLALNVGGQILGMAHGHQFRDATKYIAGQATGRTPVGDSDVLLTGHYHHFHAQNIGHRLWIQVPAMDGGSPWYRERTGLDSPTGIVSFVMGNGFDPRRELAVISGQNRR